jgi:hypothetical protein
MSQAGLLWGANDPPSPFRLDAKGVFWGTGLEILAIPQTSEVKVAVCTVTGSGFIENTMYVRSADKTQWLPVFGKHLHDQDTDAAGGKLAAIYRANQATVQKFVRWSHSQWRGNDKSASSPAPTLGSSGGSFYMDLSTSTTDETYNTVIDGDGLKADLTKPISVSWKAQFSHNAQVVGRMGVNVENVQNSVVFGNKFWTEFCDAHGTKIMAATSNPLGTTIQPSATDVVVAPTNVARGFRLDYTPISQVFYSDSAGGSVTLTTNVPSSGQVSSDRIFVAGIQTKNASQVKTMFIWKVEATYEVADTWL